MNEKRLQECELCHRPIQKCHCLEVPDGKPLKERKNNLEDFV